MIKAHHSTMDMPCWALIALGDEVKGQRLTAFIGRAPGQCRKGQQRHGSHLMAGHVPLSVLTGLVQCLRWLLGPRSWRRCGVSQPSAHAAVATLHQRAAPFS